MGDLPGDPDRWWGRGRHRDGTAGRYDQAFRYEILWSFGSTVLDHVLAVAPPSVVIRGAGADVTFIGPAARESDWLGVVCHRGRQDELIRVEDLTLENLKLGVVRLADTEADAASFDLARCILRHGADRIHPEGDILACEFIDAGLHAGATVRDRTFTGGATALLAGPVDATLDRCTIHSASVALSATGAVSVTGFRIVALANYLAEPPVILDLTGNWWGGLHGLYR